MDVHTPPPTKLFRTSPSRASAMPPAAGFFLALLLMAVLYLALGLLIVSH